MTIIDHIVKQKCNKFHHSSMSCHIHIKTSFSIKTQNLIFMPQRIRQIRHRCLYTYASDSTIILIYEKTMHILDD